MANIFKRIWGAVKGSSLPDEGHSEEGSNGEVVLPPIPPPPSEGDVMKALVGDVDLEGLLPATDDPWRRVIALFGVGMAILQCWRLMPAPKRISKKALQYLFSAAVLEDLEVSAEEIQTVIELNRQFPVDLNLRGKKEAIGRGIRNGASKLPGGVKSIFRDLGEAWGIGSSLPHPEDDQVIEAEYVYQPTEPEASVEREPYDVWKAMGLMKEQLGKHPDAVSFISGRSEAIETPEQQALYLVTVGVCIARIWASRKGKNIFLSEPALNHLFSREVAGDGRVDTGEYQQVLAKNNEVLREAASVLGDAAKQLSTRKNKGGDNA